MSTSSPELAAQLAAASSHLQQVRTEIARVIVGQGDLIHRLLVSLVARGHVLLEGLPGLAKTASVSALAQATHCQFSRIQFTPDLLPGDITGSLIYDPLKGTYSTRTGPIFANLVLADEINRAPSKVQSALLEAMQERRVSLGDTTFELGPRFLVAATQNPLEQEGTHPLPEAQWDRFLFKVRVRSVSAEAELSVLTSEWNELPTEPLLLDAEELLALRAAAAQVHIDERLLRYVVELARTTRGEGTSSHPLRYGVSTRGTLALRDAARTKAILDGRHYVHLEDLHDLIESVWAHRIGLTYEVLAEGESAESVLQKILRTVPAP